MEYIVCYKSQKCHYRVHPIETRDVAIAPATITSRAASLVHLCQNKIVNKLS